MYVVSDLGLTHWFLKNRRHNSLFASFWIGHIDGVRAEKGPPCAKKWREKSIEKMARKCIETLTLQHERAFDTQ
jgi:hypothetical protein